MSFSGCRGLLAALACLVATFGAALVASPASANPSPASLTILTPTTDAALQGSATVEMLLTDPNQTKSGKITLQLVASGANQVALTAPAFDMTGRDCSAGCEVSATIDTAAVPSSLASLSHYDAFADGSLTLKATYGAIVPTTVGSGSNATVLDMTVTATDSIPVTIDNGRPGVTATGGVVTPAGMPVATSTMTLSARPVASAGHTIRSVTLVAAGPSTSAVSFTPPTTGDGPWTLTVDTAAWRGGLSTVWVRATTDTGVADWGSPVPIYIDHGPTLAVPGRTSVQDDDVASISAAKFSFAGMPYSTTFYSAEQTYGLSLQSESITVDGGTPAVEPLTFESTNAGTILYGSAWWRADPDWTLTGVWWPEVGPGTHTVTVTAVDAYGQSGSVTYPLTVISTQAAMLTVPGKASRGAPFPVHAEVTSTYRPIDQVAWTVDGIEVQSPDPLCASNADCAMTGSFSTDLAAGLEALAPGEHTIGFQVHDFNGAWHYYATTVTLPPSVPVTSPSTPADNPRLSFVRGTVAVGSTVTAVPPHAQVAHPDAKTTITWYVNGHKVRTGRSLHLKAKWAGKTLVAKATTTWGKGRNKHTVTRTSAHITIKH